MMEVRIFKLYFYLLSFSKIHERSPGTCLLSPFSFQGFVILVSSIKGRLVLEDLSKNFDALFLSPFLRVTKVLPVSVPSISFIYFFTLFYQKTFNTG